MGRRSNNTRIAKYQRQQGDAARIARERAAQKQAQPAADAPPAEETKLNPYQRILKRLDQDRAARDQK